VPIIVMRPEKPSSRSATAAAVSPAPLPTIRTIGRSGGGCDRPLGTDRLRRFQHIVTLDAHRIAPQRVQRRRLQHRAVAEAERCFVAGTDQPVVAHRAFVQRRTGVWTGCGECADQRANANDDDEGVTGRALVMLPSRSSDSRQTT
jgi:hypothetical protein